MVCEYPLCKKKAKHPDTVLYGFTCNKHFSLLDVHDNSKRYKVEMEKIKRLEDIEILKELRLIRRR